MSVIFEKTGKVLVEWDASIKSIIVNWSDLSDGDLVRECCGAQLEQVKKGAKIIIVDVSAAKGSIPRDVQNWFENELFPQLDKAGLLEIITVNPENKSAILSAQAWKIKGALSDCKFGMPATMTLATAKELAQKMLLAE